MLFQPGSGLPDPHLVRLVQSLSGTAPASTGFVEDPADFSRKNQFLSPQQKSVPAVSVRTSIRHLMQAVQRCHCHCQISLGLDIAESASGITLFPQGNLAGNEHPQSFAAGFSRLHSDSRLGEKGDPCIRCIHDPSMTGIPVADNQTAFHYQECKDPPGKIRSVRQALSG